MLSLIRASRPGFYLVAGLPNTLLMRCSETSREWKVFVGSSESPERDWLVEHGLIGARFATLRELRAVFAEALADNGPPLPVPALAVGSEGAWTTPDGRFSVTRRHDNAWRVRDLIDLTSGPHNSPELSSCRSLSLAQNWIANRIASTANAA
jgi:hypothetical protein